MPTYDPIASITLSSSQTEVTFSNLPQIYTDLTLVVAGTHTGSGVAGLYISGINGDSNSSTYYSRTLLVGSGSAASSTRGTDEESMNLGLIGSVQTNSTFHFMNYSNNYTVKTILARSNDSSGQARAAVGNYFFAERPITSFTLTGVTFAAGTTFNLYGVGANTLKATGGDVITTDGTYWYHAFRSAGTFRPSTSLTCDVLLVAGGGGGGDAGYGGGGGGGGVLLHTSQSLTANTNYSITVGAGGANAAAGSNSQFASLTAAVGGGRGASNAGTSPAVGGSGGGGNGNFPQTGIAGTAGQGNAGGNGNGGGGAYKSLGGGGGGAGAAGANATSTVAGAGGAGTSTYSAWVNTTNTGFDGFISGGGGGGANDSSGYSAGAGGSGGGGGGTRSGTGIGNGTPGHVNSGGGGGGSGQTYGGGGSTGGAGGSGIVIVRYAV